MNLSSDLMGLGMLAALAEHVGATPLSAAGSGTTQTGAKTLTAFAIITPSAGNTAFVVTADAALLRERFICNPTAVAGVLFPPVGGSINGGAANASVAIPANGMLIYVVAANPGGSAMQIFTK